MSRFEFKSFQGIYNLATKESTYIGRYKVGSDVAGLVSHNPHANEIFVDLKGLTWDMSYDTATNTASLGKTFARNKHMLTVRQKIPGMKFGNLPSPKLTVNTGSKNTSLNLSYDTFTTEANAEATVDFPSINSSLGVRADSLKKKEGALLMGKWEPDYLLLSKSVVAYGGEDTLFVAAQTRFVKGLSARASGRPLQKKATLELECGILGEGLGISLGTTVGTEKRWGQPVLNINFGF